jgi:asparagine synthase (glutamine-hydrolysing)
MLVSRLVREHGVKGMLSGEGSDELFLGYPWLARQRVIAAYHGLGRRLRSLVRSVPSVGPILWPYEGDAPERLRDLFNRGEVAGDRARTRAAASKLPDGLLDAHQISSLDYLHYHLRTLLHRNDCLGMEASIEARFPFLDLAVVRDAINLPARAKLRFSPTVFEKAHPFVRDKWVVREVANRWIPKGLSQRIKIGFWTTVFERMRVAPEYFEGSFVQDHLELPSSRLGPLLREADPALTIRLLHLDVWAAVCLGRGTVDDTRDRIARHVSVEPV